ncbi:hypothetical protein SAMN05421736_11543 [Evansella caseinilytica]|uniref:Uncharacterized protein n=1 Tax=Evansella caseinilytica TaxID=1503961 RepID=A0A1H3TKI1_9BACI|nr:hypothetical protein SAMN05421736_11543 [Evansella caseinilytica]
MCLFKKSAFLSFGIITKQRAIVHRIVTERTLYVIASVGTWIFVEAIQAEEEIVSEADCIHFKSAMSGIVYLAH